MPETCTDIYGNRSQFLHQVGTSRRLQLKFTQNNICV